MKIFLLVFSVFILKINAENVHYKGYKVYETIARHKNHTDLLAELAETPVYDFWKLSKIPNDNAHVMVAPEYQNDFESILRNNEMEFTIINSDVEESIDRERHEHSILRRINSPTHSRIGFSSYYRHDDINAYLDQLAIQYSNRVTVSTVGKSYEGRTMKAIKITNGVNTNSKKIIFVDAGIHAREWIAPATALYIIQQLVENFNENRQLLEHYNWIVLPLVNPDGYEYTHTRERFWRKTRKPNRNCAGTDANRNFDYHWGEVGASSNECSEIYKGPSAFSEPETEIVRKMLEAEKGRCKFYLTLHSYGQYLLYPWGWTSDLPKTWKDLDEVAQAGASAMRAATGTRYTVGSSTNVLYAAAGGSDDYAFGVEDVPISITMELPGNSFNPPASQIKRMVTEAWIGIKAMAQKVEQKY